MSMTYKDAIVYLRPVADNHPLAGYSAALNVAIRALEEVEQLNAEKTQLLDDLKQSLRHEPCDYCKHAKEPVPCAGSDYVCDECTHHGCFCYDCRDCSKWEWRGIPVEKEG